MNHLLTLEFDQILKRLSDCALSATVKQRCLSLIPSKSLSEARRLTEQTTQAKKIIEQTGSPPLPHMTELQKTIALLDIESMLTPEQIAHVSTFLMSCRRMKDYLKRAEITGVEIAFYGSSIIDLSYIDEEISRCIRNGQIDDRASQQLYDLRRAIGTKGEQIKSKLEALLRKNKEYYSEGFVSMRNGRYTLPVKKEYKSKVDGILVELSNTGSTCFIEPTAVRRLQDELVDLQIAEDSEIRRILYTLTALIYDSLPTIKVNVDAIEALDFLFAKAKLSIDMNASPMHLINDRDIRILSARHPLLQNDTAVPLDFALGGNTSGIIITGPNTGGKTVALKTVGLLSLMAQSGLHAPADERSCICMFDSVLCDIGDGQSIAENLSTFSAHMTNIIEILETATSTSLVLLDELGSGTDPAEGMGIAMAVLEELLAKSCLFTVTTHYPEIKDFAANTSGLINARMAFNKESLMPLYKLEIGEAGESCALYIAERLGMPAHLLSRARYITYLGASQHKTVTAQESIVKVTPLEISDNETKSTIVPRSQRFAIGDSVIVYPQKKIGIVYSCANEKGELGVQIKGQKQLINHKRIKLKVAATELYPENYDYSIVFESVENRKAHHVMNKKHVEGNIVTIENSKDI